MFKGFLVCVVGVILEFGILGIRIVWVLCLSDIGSFKNSSFVFKFCSIYIFLRNYIDVFLYKVERDKGYNVI